MARLRHPNIKRIQRTVPDAAAPDWERAGWVWMDKPKPKAATATEISLHKGE